MPFAPIGNYTAIKNYQSALPFGIFTAMIPSRYIEEAVNEVASLPGVGRKTALRYVLNLLSRNEADVERFTNSISNMRMHLKLCAVCNHISDHEVCGVCSNPSRDASIICVVEDIRDVMAIEATHQYKGVYHVLGGKISPMDGIGPSDLKIAHLLERLGKGNTKELILALSPTMEGDTTSYYIFRKMTVNPACEVTTLSRGLAVGDELQYADEITLGKSILHRTPYHKASH